MRLLNNAANILGSSALQNELFKTSCKKPREIKKKPVMFKTFRFPPFFICLYMRFLKLYNIPHNQFINLPFPFLLSK